MIYCAHTTEDKQRFIVVDDDVSLGRPMWCIVHTCVNIESINQHENDESLWKTI